MPLVKISKSKPIDEILIDYELSAIEINVLLALQSNGGALEIIDLVEAVRKRNATSYKFVQDKRFYSAVSRLANKQYVTYG